MPTKKLAFRMLILKQRALSDLGKIEIGVKWHYPGEYNSYSTEDLFKVTWHVQSAFGGQGDPLGVFGFKVLIESGGLYDFENSVKTARHLMKKLTEHTPRAAIEALKAVGAIEVVSDSRERQVIPLDEVKGPEWMDYLDDYKTLGNLHCMYNTLASSEVEAKAAMLAEANKSTRSDASKWTQKFVAAGLPVLVSKFARCPDVTPAIERLEKLVLADEQDLIESREER